VTLEDLKGKVEAVLFPDEFLKFRSFLTPDAIVFVEGEVDRKREEPSIRASRVVPVDQVSRDLAKSLLIDVQADTSIERLVAALRAHRGDCRVYLNVATEDGAVVQIECNPSLRVACTSELFTALRGLVPQHAVRVVGPQRQQIPVGKTSPAVPSLQPVAV
jgi:DNA polymerase-3 subunit alpha